METTDRKVVMGSIVVSWKRSSEKDCLKIEGSYPFESCKSMYVLCMVKGGGVVIPRVLSPKHM